VAGLLRQVDKVFVDDAAHAVARAVDALDARKRRASSTTPTRRLVDDGGGAAALGDEDFSGWPVLAPRQMAGAP
jgi:hypothetical protein